MPKKVWVIGRKQMDLGEPIKNLRKKGGQVTQSRSRERSQQQQWNREGDEAEKWAMAPSPLRKGSHKGMEESIRKSGSAPWGKENKSGFGKQRGGEPWA